MGFVDAIKNNEFVLLAEIDPPKGSDISSLKETAALLKGRVNALLVTDTPSAVMTMSSISASHLLNNLGHETICNITCRDRNIIALQSDILGAAAIGIKSLYISNGDDITYGDHPNANPVKEVGPDDLLGIIKKMKDGEDSAGNKLEAAPSLHVGGYVNCNAEGEGLSHWITRVQVMERLGVSFLITPPVFDVNALDKFVKKVREKSDMPIIASLILLKSVATARFLNLHVEGVNVPDSILDRLVKAGDKAKESIAVAAELIKGYKDVCQGVNIVAMGWEAKIPAYLDAAGMQHL